MAQIFFYNIIWMDQEKVVKPLRVVVMSDTHDIHHKINVAELPQADIFIHCGDFTKASSIGELARFRQFLTMLPYKHKVVIAGNHDFNLDKVYWEKQSKKAKQQVIPEVEIQKLKEICTYLEHEQVEIEGLKIFGSPYSLEFYDWGFMYAQKDAKNLWDCIPKGTDILITHGPPYGVLDKTINGNYAGCRDLLTKVYEIKPQFHLFGHIHEAYGRLTNDGITFINASTVNLGYRLTNKPQVFEILPKCINP